MEDNLNFLFQMEDDLNILVNGRQTPKKTRTIKFNRKQLKFKKMVVSLLWVNPSVLTIS